MALDLSVLDGESGFISAGAGCAPRAALALFEEDPGNPRFEADPPEFELLVADVRARGILQPLVVRRLDNGRLRIRFGARRFRAAVAAGLADAPYVVTEDARQFDDYAQVAENERRSPLQPLELAAFAARKIAEGESKASVAQRLGIHPSALSHLLCLAGDVPPFLLELYHGRRCRTPVYLYRLRRLWRRDPERIEAVCAAAGEIGAAVIDALECTPDLASDAVPLSKVPVGPGALPAALAGAVPLADRIPGKGSSASKDRSGSVSAGAGFLARPRLFGKWQGREVLLVLHRRPSAPDLIVVRYCDGDGELEVCIDEIVLKALRGGAQSLSTD
jgi:ParB family chromosome partitioning protein